VITSTSCPNIRTAIINIDFDCTAKCGVRCAIRLQNNWHYIERKRLRKLNEIDRVKR
jgi:hypothetical protein